MTREYDILNIGLSILKYTGAHPFQRKWSYTLFIIITTSRLFYLYFTFQLLIQRDKSDDLMQVLVNFVLSFASFMQGLTKLFVLLQKDRLMYLITSMDKFWPQDGNIEFIENIYTYGTRILKVFRTIVFSTLIMYFTVPIFTHELMFACTIPDIPYGFQILFGGQYIQIFFDACYMSATDILFLALNINIIAQFKLLQHHMERLHEEQNISCLHDKFKRCINHHMFLLSYSKTVINCYKFSLVMQYSISIFAICIELFILTESRDIFVLGNSIMYMTTILAQLAMYCFPAEETTRIASEVSLSIYKSEWYTCPVFLQKYVHHIIRRSQLDVKFTAGGMVPINREALTIVFKSAISFYALIRQLKEKQVVQ